MSAAVWKNGKLRAPMNRALLAAAVISPFVLANSADAQTVQTTESASTETGDQEGIVVTGTRIMRDGYDSPVPVAVLGSEEINAQKPANLATFVSTLPAVTAGSSSQNSSGFLSGGLAGIASVNLRALGQQRTLVLVDGQRSVGSSAAQTVDINTIPQQLVERVEVVTGGASAQYGSDAIGGVVNFILNKKFTGLKLSADQGITTYGDGYDYHLGGAFGRSFIDDRLHVMAAVDYNRQNPVKTIDRPWNKSGYYMISNPAYTATNGQPQYYVGTGLGPATVTKGGLISSGPLRGTYFLTPGNTGQLNFGTNNAISAPWMIGGDSQVTLDGIEGTNSLIANEKRISTFGRVSFNVSDGLTIFGQVSWNRYRGASNYAATASNPVTILADNAYLTTQYPQVAAQMAANNLGSIAIGTTNAGFPVPGSDNTREILRYVIGGEGKFTLFDNSWKWNAYYQHGETTNHYALTNTWNNARLALAQDAVVVTAANVGASGLALGSIACRSTLANPSNGCIPINRLGTNGPSAAALAYIFGPGQPNKSEVFKQDVAAVTVTGDLFDLPGGPAAIALGGEWRRESVTTPPIDPLYTSGWLYGNYFSNKGSFNVKEGFAELSLPVLKGLTIDGAARYADYSTVGSAFVWKVGGTYSPIDDVKLRGTYSHDLRAPNIQELFYSFNGSNSTLIFPNNAPTPGPVTVMAPQLGNPNLGPEKATTWTVGAVVSPRFIPGLDVSFDYFDIRIKDAISQVTSQQSINYCYTGFTQFCNNITYSGNTPTSVAFTSLNFAKQRTRGFDISANYRVHLSDISENLPGKFSVRADVTHYIENVVDNLILPIDYAGVNGGSQLLGFFNTNFVPSWVYRVSALYDIDPVTFNLVGRGFSSGKYGNHYIECTSSCPAATAANPTTNNNHIAGAIYFDAAVNFKIPSDSGPELTIGFVVNNLFNRAPSPVANGPSSPNIYWAYAQTNHLLYDLVGRRFRMTAAVKF